MSTTIRKIRPLMWSYGGKGSHQDHEIHLDKFTLPQGVYAAMQRQSGPGDSRQRKELNARIGGLGEILALEVPHRPAFFTSRDDRQKGRKSLTVFWLRGGRRLARPHLGNALDLWLRNTYPLESDQLISDLAGAVDNPECWEEIAISPKPPVDDTLCGGPATSMYFDALAAHVGTHLAGTLVEWPDGSKEPLIPMVPTGSLYSGFELLIGTPKAVENKHGVTQYFAEALTISTATLANQGALGVQVLARVSKRHWTPITKKGPFANGKFQNRSLTVVRNPGSDPSCPFGWHAPLKFIVEVAKGERGNSPWHADAAHPIYPQWHNEYAAQALHRLLDFQPGEFPKISDDGHLIPAYSETANAWVLPTFSTRAEDSDAAHGMGVGFPDRRTVMQAINSELQSLNLVLSEPFERPTAPHSPVGTVVTDKSDKEGNERKEGELDDSFLQALARTTRVAGSNDGVDMVVMACRSTTTDEVRKTITALTGVSWRMDGERRWESKGHPFTFRLKEVNSGPFSPPASNRNALGERPPSKQVLGEYFERACGDFRPDVAILEMDKRLRSAKADPYENAYKALHGRGVLPQAVLADIEDENKQAGKKALAARKGKIKHAVLDCLRMLGAVIIPEEDLGEMAVAGLSMIGSRPYVKDIPVAVLATTSGLKAAQLPVGGPEGGGTIVEWVPYRDFLLGVRNGEVASTLPKGWEKGPDRILRVEAFMGAVLADLNGRFERCLVMVDGVGVKQCFPAMKNERLVFDRIGFGYNASQWQMTPQKALSNLAVVRIVHERAKMPQYIPLEYENDETEKGRRWVQGVHFPPQQERVGYALIAEPTTRHKDNEANTRPSRKPGDNEPHKNRATAALVEMALVSRPDWVDDPRRPIVRSARLRARNVQYLKNETTFPFPLHEARLLGEH